MKLILNTKNNSIVVEGLSTYDPNGLYHRDQIIYTRGCKGSPKRVRENMFYSTQKGSPKFRQGYLPYIVKFNYDKLDKESFELYKKLYISEIQLPKFDNLFDYQQEDLEKLTVFKRGVCQLRTGYGKTEMIATLINYVANIRKERILVVAPNDVSVKELYLRCKSKNVVFPHKVFNAGKANEREEPAFDENSDFNIINVNGKLREKDFDFNAKYWKDIKWVIADECENVVTGNSKKLFDNLLGAEYWYGFSGTADKKKGMHVWIDNKDGIMNNHAMVEFFGFGIVYKEPIEIGIECAIYKYNTNVAERLPFNSPSEAYKCICTSDQYISILLDIANERDDTLFVPLEYLQVLNEMINKILIIKNIDIDMLLICGDGYIEYSSSGQKNTITYEEAKINIESNKYKIIFSTKSGFRALDVKGLRRILPLTQTASSHLLQAVGRCTRQEDMTIYRIIPDIEVKYYSSDNRLRMMAIEDFFKNDNIKYRYGNQK